MRQLRKRASEQRGGLVAEHPGERIVRSDEASVAIGDVHAVRARVEEAPEAFLALPPGSDVVHLRYEARDAPGLVPDRRRSDLDPDGSAVLVQVALLDGEARKRLVMHANDTLFRC